MQSTITLLSPWHRLKKGEISSEKALSLLVDETGIVKVDLLDNSLSNRFFRQLRETNDLPPIIPLLLWQNCYYLGSPVSISPQDIKNLQNRTLCDIKIIPIADKSYRAWYLTQTLNNNSINATSVINPLTGEPEPEDITETTELYLSKADDQITRIKTIISGALRNRASDIHLEPTPEGLRVRYRIDGILRDITTLPLEISRRVVVAIKVMSDMNIAESRRPQDGRISEKYADGNETELGLDMRVSTLPCIGGEKVVIRLLPKQNPFSSLDDLGFPPQILPIYKKWLSQPQGLIILTGPTGSGKTSTLYNSLLAIATENVNVTTVEDPVEYVLPRITQTQVHEQAGMTLAAGLRAILRQDPDIIMLGEIRDRETAETAVRAALTGHLVLTTLHTNDAISAIPRLKDIGPDPGLIADALLGIVAQRLARKICPHCCESYTPTEADLKLLAIEEKQINSQEWRCGRGCPNCFHSGYLGRQAIVEMLNVDSKIRQLIYGGNMSDLSTYINQSNFYSFRNSAIEKVTAGTTTLKEVLRVLPHSALLDII